MWRGAVAVALLIGCRGEPAPAPRVEPAPVVSSVVPALPQSPDGAQELVALDLQIEQARAANDREALIGALSRRAMLRGRHQDLRDALLHAFEWRAAEPKNRRALSVWIATLLQTHQFSEAEARVGDLQLVAEDPSEWEPAVATLAEVRGKPELARAYRERTAATHPTPAHLTALAANLALRGQLDEAIAMIPRAAAALRDPSPVLISWLLVQWSRFHVQKGELAAARQLLEEAHRRLPGYVDATVQLATTMRATAGDPGELLAAALATERFHPELLALAGRTADAHQEWTIALGYPLENAYADHAARFYLGAGSDPERARRLAATNFVNRPTLDARALLVETELARGKPQFACEQSAPLTTGTRAHQFLAWRAFTACGQTAEAGRLAQTLGIH